MDYKKDAEKLAEEIGEAGVDIETGFGGAVEKIGNTIVTEHLIFARPSKLTDYAAGVEYDINYEFGGARTVTKRRVMGTVGTIGDQVRRRRN